MGIIYKNYRAYKNNSQKQIQKLFKINKNLLLVREVVK